MQTSGKKWDSFETEFAIDDLDRDALDAFRKKAVSNNRLSQSAANVSDITLINNLNLLTHDHRLKRAAVAMFGNPETVAVGSYIKIAYFAPAGTHGMNSANEIIYHDDVHGPLIMQADKAVEILYAKYFKALISYKGLQRTETYMLPEDVIREVLLNAIMHKNYASGNPIQVRVYDDHITVMNEGFWPFDVLPVKDAYKPDHESYQYNPLLADIFYKTGEVEAWGQGFGKISNACQKYDCPLPEITATDRSVKLTCNGCREYMELLKETNNPQPSDVQVSAQHAKAFSHMEEILSLHLTESEKKRLLPVQFLTKPPGVIIGNSAILHQSNLLSSSICDVSYVDVCSCHFAHSFLLVNLISSCQKYQRTDHPSYKPSDMCLHIDLPVPESYHKNSAALPSE